MIPDTGCREGKTKCGKRQFAATMNLQRVATGRMARGCEPGFEVWICKLCAAGHRPNRLDRWIAHAAGRCAGRARQVGERSAGWETRDTADLEVCGTKKTSGSRRRI